MKINTLHIVLRSIAHYKVQFLNQFIIILFLAAIITGSLLTGSAVKTSILEGNTAGLNGTGFIISSGNRYMPASLANRFRDSSGEKSEGLMEQKGWVRNFSSDESALDVQIIGVENSFFEFDGIKNDLVLTEGNAIINRKLAEKLNLKTGDDIVIRLGTPSDLPADSPFAPVIDSYESFILTVSDILSGENEENFSLGINQVKPHNIFVPLTEFSSLFEGEKKINRILIKNSSGLSVELLNNKLKEIYSPEDAGLKIRQTSTTERIEIISDRVFISSNELEEVMKTVPEARPVLTYLANSISLKERSTPYSFVAGIHPDLADKIPGENGIIINQWLADDLDAKQGDTLRIDYFIAGKFKDFIELNTFFIVESIIQTESSFNDANLMPEFPGISGSESCRDWDAGAPVNMNRIRDKDEDYWYDYNGTPKAIVNYNTANNIWGNDFGPATAIRFTGSGDIDDLSNKLEGKINPFLTGVSIIPIEDNARKAAENSVDFTTLFLSLGFFMLLSCIILLILIISSHIESRFEHLRIYKALGFDNGRIFNYIYFELLIIALAGSLGGILLGNLFDNILIGTLNSVWKGAVQTSTLETHSDPSSLILGFISTLVIVAITTWIQLRIQLKKSYAKDIRKSESIVIRKFKIIFPVLAIITAGLFVFALIKGLNSTAIWFILGAQLMIFLLFGIVHYLKRSFVRKTGGLNQRLDSSGLYYGMHPGRAITPILFLAAGLFIVIVTGANRKSFNTNDIKRGGGTGGFTYWAETATPLLFDLNSQRGRYEYNIENDVFKDMYFVQAKKADGDDASCLNLNQVDSPPILGLDAANFAETGAFSFASRIKSEDNPWNLLSLEPRNNTIYGIADQTVLQWSLYKETGDTLVFTSESGEELNVIIAAGLTSSIFQGHILIGEDNFNKYYPSISGSSIFLADVDSENSQASLALLKEGLAAYGIDIQNTSSRLAGFYEVTNTYLDVFLSLGGLGMILGVVGMGFVLLRNFNSRKTEYAFMLASGFSHSFIRKSILKDNLLILSAGIIIGIIAAPVATLPSLLSEAHVPLGLILGMIVLVFLFGILAISVALRNLINNNLITSLRRE